ncbi:MAG: hypothetical protein UU82_C0016G0004 [Candidatus Nomurabacteria bacterium GW2011_GWC2_41_8]|uniref:Uncharacterized protein n=2 Tax=Candidatus Nomuraibacteriota TaxID=1752729 RepID=A0A0G0XHJ3_9BACT|nr:MAG: hypothetical protein UU58_C0001G0081 [Candidatus Nomurabacteria bacterium GW2011_GWA2_41_25]KKS23922.1 MAG: hypothetical protein UU82_C0016G0004 [Candidatus Nomurabacteria bacterium GW2011_GWC2_41_8]
MKYKLLYISSVSPKRIGLCAKGAILREEPERARRHVTERSKGAVSERSKVHLC